MFDRKYKNFKGLVNSLYGVTAFPSFRLYNYDIASSITFLARDLLRYTEAKMQSFGHKVYYTDTDALVYESTQDEIDLLNKKVTSLEEELTLTEKKAKLVKPSWYENKWLYFTYGAILSYSGISILNALDNIF